MKNRFACFSYCTVMRFCRGIARLFERLAYWANRRAAVYNLAVINERMGSR